MLIDWSRGADRRDSKGAHVSHAPLPSRSSTELSQAAQLGEGTSLQRPRSLRDASTLHPPYSSARLKKVVLCPISDRQNFTNELSSAATISAQCWSSSFGGGRWPTFCDSHRAPLRITLSRIALAGDVFRPTRRCRKAHPISFASC